MSVYLIRARSRRRHPDTHHGFTLVEALAATALLALLATALAGVSIGWMHAQRAVSHDADHGAPARRTLMAIADDLRAAAPGSIIVVETADAFAIQCITAHPIPTHSGRRVNTKSLGWHRVRWFVDHEAETVIREAQPIDGPTGTPPLDPRVVLLGATGLFVTLDDEPEASNPQNNTTQRPRTITIDLMLTNTLDETHHAAVRLHASSLGSPQSQEPRRAGSR